MAQLDTFDVVVVPFPFTDRPVAKRRPAMAVSSTEFNKAHEGKILAMVTSATARWETDVPLQGWGQAGLHVVCWVRFRLFTLDEDLTLRKTGTLSKRDGEAVKAMLSQCLAS